MSANLGSKSTGIKSIAFMSNTQMKIVNPIGPTILFGFGKASLTRVFTKSIRDSRTFCIPVGAPTETFLPTLYAMTITILARRILKNIVSILIRQKPSPVAKGDR